MQADRRLARPRPALDHERPFDGLRDQLVLLGRDRGDDLAHLADALPRDVLDDRVGQHLVALAGGERLVDVAVDGALVDLEPAAPHHAVVVGGRRGVVGLRGGRAPVDREQVVVAVGDRVAADVQHAPVRLVDPPEVQRAGALRVEPQVLAPHALERLGRPLVDRPTSARPRARAGRPRRPPTSDRGAAARRRGCRRALRARPHEGRERNTSRTTCSATSCLRHRTPRSPLQQPRSRSLTKVITRPR